MTIRHNETSGEAPPLPVSVPLVQVWGMDNNNPETLGWHAIQCDQWPNDIISRSVFVTARDNPGKSFRFTSDDGDHYRVVWSEGPAPAAFTTPAPTRDHARAAQERLFPVRLDKDGPPTLPEICVYIRNAIRGDNPAVVMPDEELKKVRAALESRRAAWEDSKRDPCGKFPVLFREFETMISNMVIITIGIITEELKLRAECGVSL